MSPFDDDGQRDRTQPCCLSLLVADLPHRQKHVVAVREQAPLPQSQLPPGLAQTEIGLRPELWLDLVAPITDNLYAVSVVILNA
jgi:hypothetical protein